MPVAINAITSTTGSGNLSPRTDGWGLPSGTNAQRLLGTAFAIRGNTTSTVIEATLDGATYFTIGSATGPILSITGTANRITVSPGVNPVIDIAATYVGQTSITTLGTITTGVWAGTAITEIHGGTNQTTYILGDTLYSSAANTLSKLAGNITAVKQYLSQIGTGAVSAAPVWATISGGDITGAALTKTDDTNVTLTLGGTPTTALLRATSLTLGWTGQLALTRGGTNASLIASNGGIVWSNASQFQILAGTATALQMLQSGSTATPSWSTATWPATTTINQILYSSAANTVTGLATANRAVLTTTSAGVPVQTALATDGQLIIGSTAGAPAAASLTAGTGITITPGSNSISIAVTGGAAVTSVSGTANRITSTGGTTPVIDISAAYVGQTSITTLGTVTTGTWNASVIGLVYGGTNANLTASNGGIVWSNATQMQILAGTATANQVLLSGSTATPAWSTATYPATTTINRLLYSSAANTITDLATANSAVLITSAGGVPSLSTTLPSGIAATNMNLTTPTLGVASATSINFGGTALANYVEGTWTPTFISSGGGSATYTTQVGAYTRIGNMVHITANIVLSGLPSAGNVAIGGIPLNTAATYTYSLSTVGQALSASVTQPILCLATPSQSVFTLYTFTTGSVTQLTVAQCTSTTVLYISGFYKV